VPASIDHRIAFNWALVFHSPRAIANGIIINAPTKLRQKIMVGMGIIALAIIGPEDPIPRTPRMRKGISRPVGNLIIVMNP
jgi:hypothetical protein